MHITFDYTVVALQPKDTVVALLKLYNRPDITFAQLKQLEHLFIEINGRKKLVAGQEVKIPKIFTYAKEEVENSIETQRTKTQDREELRYYVSPIREVNEASNVAILTEKEKFLEKIKSTSFAKLTDMKRRLVKSERKLSISRVEANRGSLDVENIHKTEEQGISSEFLFDFIIERGESGNVSVRLSELDGIETAINKVMTKLSLPPDKIGRFKKTKTYKRLLKVYQS